METYGIASMNNRFCVTMYCTVVSYFNCFGNISTSGSQHIAAAQYSEMFINIRDFIS